MTVQRDLTLLQQNSRVFRYTAPLFCEYRTTDGGMILTFHLISSSTIYFVLTLTIPKSGPLQKKKKKATNRLLIIEILK